MFRYRDPQGFERRLINHAALVDAIRAGVVRSGTPLAEGVDGPWGVAGRHPAFAEAQRPRGAIAGRIHALRGAAGIAGRLAHPRLVVAGVVVVLVLVSGAFVVGEMKVRAIERQRLAYATAMLELAEGRAPAAEVLAQPAPAADDGALRTAWVRMQVAHAIRRSIDSAQAAVGVSGFHPPEAWLSDAYVMDPAAHAAIGDHWQAYLAWDRAWSPDALERMHREERRRSAEARLTERQIFELIDPAQPGLSAIGWDLELRRQFAAEASRLHTTLVESRGNVVLDDGAWWFADTRTARAYAEHVQKLRRLAGQLEANAARRAAALGIEEAGRAVPVGIAHMRPAGG